MCRGIISEMQGRRTHLLHHEEMKHIYGYCGQHPPQGLGPAPAGLAIVAAFEEQLAQSLAAAAQAPAVESALHSLPIPIRSSAAHHEVLESADNKILINDDFPASDQQSKFYHNNYRINTRLYYEEEAPISIFSTALSPPDSSYNYSYYYPSHRSDLDPLSTDDFLGACVSCKRVLGPHKDIYMYRGDRAFCSTECRYKHIMADESLSSKTHNIGAQTSSSINMSTFTPMAAIMVLC